MAQSIEHPPTLGDTIMTAVYQVLEGVFDVITAKYAIPKEELEQIFTDTWSEPMQKTHVTQNQTKVNSPSRSPKTIGNQCEYIITRKGTNSKEQCTKPCFEIYPFCKTHCTPASSVATLQKMVDAGQLPAMPSCVASKNAEQVTALMMQQIAQGQLPQNSIQPNVSRRKTATTNTRTLIATNVPAAVFVNEKGEPVNTTQMPVLQAQEKHSGQIPEYVLHPNMVGVKKYTTVSSGQQLTQNTFLQQGTKPKSKSPTKINPVQEQLSNLVNDDVDDEDAEDLNGFDGY